MCKNELPEATIKRLPVYYRNICALESKGVERVTSKLLAEKVGNTDTQVRQDFYACGGIPGYEIKELKKWLEEKLGLNYHYNAVIVGTGNLGRAIISYPEFSTERFFISAAFDSNLMLEGMQIKNIPILNVSMLGKYLSENRVDIVIIATPASAALGIYNIAKEHGIKGIWNFAPVDLKSDDETFVNNVHLTDNLMLITAHLAKK